MQLHAFRPRWHAAAVAAWIVSSSITMQASAQTAGLTGTFEGTPDLGFALTLTLESVGTDVQGRLIGDGIDFTLQGTVDATDPATTRASGTATNATATVGFTLAYLSVQGGLTLDLFELDALGRPVPATTITTTFTAQAGAVGAAPAPGANPLAPPAVNPLAPPAPVASPWLGTFADATVTLVVTAATAAEAEGTVAVGGQSYPFRVTLDPSGRATGAFEASGSSFSLRLTLEGDVLALETDGASYSLTRVGQTSDTAQGARGVAAPPSSPPSPSPSTAGDILLDVTSDLDATDDLLAGGERYELHPLELQAGVPVRIRAQSDVFDVYVVVIDAAQTTVFEVDDTPGLGTNVDDLFVPSATGAYGVVLTSAYANEVGRYTLQVGLDGAGAASTGRVEVDDPRGSIAAGAYGSLTYDDVDALFESLEFALSQVGIAQSFGPQELDQAYAWFAQNYASLSPEEQALFADARTVWTNVQANWPAADQRDRYEFVIGVLSFWYGDEQVRSWLGLPASGGASAGGGGGAFEDWASANGLDPYDANTSAAQGCWAAAGCSSYDSVDGFVYEDPSY